MPRLLLAILLAAVAAPAPGQMAVPVHQEPRHYLVHDGDDFRVLDIRLASGDTTLFHTHGAPIAYVAIDTAAVNAQPLDGEWGDTDASADAAWRPGQVTWNLSYATEPLTHRITTVGPGLFRLMGIINYGPGAADGSFSTSAMIGSIEAESRWFRVSRLTLNPGQRVLWDRSAHAVVAVVVTEGLVVASQHGRTAEAAVRGGFFVQDTGEPYELRNPGPTPVSLAFVQLR